MYNFPKSLSSLHSITNWYSSSNLSHTINVLSLYGILIGLCHLPVSIPLFRYRENSVHLHEYSPFWVGVEITTFNKEKYYVYCSMETCAL